MGNIRFHNTFTDDGEYMEGMILWFWEFYWASTPV